jgi:chromosome segregation ATPase
MYAETLAPLRTQLADSEKRQRNTEREIYRAKAEAEQRILAEKGGEKALGSNAEAQKRALSALVEADPVYAALAQTRFDVENEVAHLRAQVAGIEDQRREWEWTIRERLATALLRRDAPDEQHHPEDGVWDAAIDCAVDHCAQSNNLTAEELLSVPF